MDGISLRVERGERIAILGPNGAGKTTLLRILAGEERPRIGKVVPAKSALLLSSHAMGLPSNLTVEQATMMLLRAGHHLQGASSEPRRSDLQTEKDFVLDFSELYDRRHQMIGTLSKGQQLRLRLSALLANLPEVLLVDEALSAGDSNFRSKFEIAYRQKLDEGRTLVLVTHVMSQARGLCTRGIVVSRGRIEYDGGITQAIEIVEDGSYDRGGIRRDSDSGSESKGLPAKQSTASVRDVVGKRTDNEREVDSGPEYAHPEFLMLKSRIFVPSRSLESSMLQQHEQATVEIEFKGSRDLVQKLNFAIVLYSFEGVVLALRCSAPSVEALADNGFLMTGTWNSLSCPPGQYVLVVSVYSDQVAVARWRSGRVDVRPSNFGYWPFNVQLS